MNLAVIFLIALFLAYLGLASKSMLKESQMQSSNYLTMPVSGNRTIGYYYI